MLKDDTKDQIPLFELPQPEKPAEKPAPPKAETEKRAVRERKPAAKTEEKKPVALEAKRKEAPKPAGREKPAKAPQPGPVPAGDVRLTANIREDLHLRLKIVAATRRTTIGELIEELVETYL